MLGKPEIMFYDKTHMEPIASYFSHQQLRWLRRDDVYNLNIREIDHNLFCLVLRTARGKEIISHPIEATLEKIAEIRIYQGHYFRRMGIVLEIQCHYLQNLTFSNVSKA